jgi:hypothetical protein
VGFCLRVAMKRARQPARLPVRQLVILGECVAASLGMGRADWATVNPSGMSVC